MKIPVDPGGTKPPSQGPELPKSVPSAAAGAADNDADAAFLMNSPFAQMFRASGATPTVKEIRSIINNLLMQQVRNIKKNDMRWKKIMRKWKRKMQGNG